MITLLKARLFAWSSNFSYTLLAQAATAIDCEARTHELDEWVSPTGSTQLFHLATGQLTMRPQLIH
jgi:hypothetical protein